ncbi:MAG TPA: T9SS type A sorting domain-containing protein [Flavobacterium sp.]|jgi:uncharacterized repeat protein (TIGR01451 family)|nr:T9SS type A sorting domain-containing protein [Flavobacterium sp.]
MKKNYFFLLLVLALGFMAPAVFAQAQSDYVSVSNGTGPTVVIQDVLANDTYQGMQATLSNVHFTSVSSTSGYLELDQNTGSVIFSNGPAPTGSYQLQYSYDGIGLFNDLYTGLVTVNIGCAEVNAPNVTVSNPNCGTTTLNISGLPPGGWWIYDNGTIVTTGTLPTTTLTVQPGHHSIQVANFQNCLSPPTEIDAGFLDAFVVGTYVDTNSDGIPNVGDHINYTATLTNLSSVCTLSNITSSGNSPMIGGPLATLAAGASNNSTFTYSHAITQSNVNAGSVTNYFGFTASTGSTTTTTFKIVSNYLNIADGIKLVAFVDTNGNGIKDGTEQDFAQGSFSYVVNDGGTNYQVSASPLHSVYIYETNPINSYDITFNVYSEFASWYSVANPTINNITVPNGSGVVAYYFPMTFIPYTDLAVDIYNNNPPPRPGFTYQNTIKYTNRGSLAIANGTVTFTKPAAVSISSISVTGTTANANGFTYDFTNLLPGHSRYINITLQVPTIPTVALGDVLTATAAVTIPAGDVDASNNTDEINQTIVGSYDPNDKTENHGGKVLYSAFTANDYLTYKIQFENTGTFPAEFVRVVDVLDDKLDETTVRMVDASHSYTLTRVGKELTWMFDDIQLPPSVANTNIGHGYLVFKVKPKTGFALGDVIPNIASIYFDFNPPIVTEPCVTEFVNTLATRDFALDNFRYSPNPVKNNLKVSNDNVIDTITVTSVLGQVVFEKSVNALDAVIDLSGLSHGVYLIKASSLSATKTLKIVKE